MPVQSDGRLSGDGFVVIHAGRIKRPDQRAAHPRNADPTLRRADRADHHQRYIQDRRRGQGCPPMEVALDVHQDCAVPINFLDKPLPAS